MTQSAPTPTARATRTPREERASRKVALARRLDAALREHGTSRAHLALDLGVCESKIVAWADLRSGQSIPAADLEALPPLVLRALLEPLAEQLGLALVERGAPSDVAGALSLLARVADEGRDCVVALADAVTDGHVDAVEGERLSREGGQLERVGRSVRELGERAVRERVVEIAEGPHAVPGGMRVVPRRAGR